MNERAFLTISQTERVRQTLSKELTSAVRILSETTSTDEQKFSAYVTLQSVSTQAVRAGQFDIAQHAFSAIPSNAQRSVTSSGGITTVDRYKKDLLRSLLTNYADAGLGSMLSDLREERDRAYKNNPENKDSIKSTYAAKAKTYRESEGFHFFYSFLLKQIEEDQILRAQLTETPLWGTLFKGMIETVSLVGANEKINERVMKFFELLPHQQHAHLLKTEAVTNAARMSAGVDREGGSSFKTLGPLSGVIDIRRAFTMLESVSVKNSQGVEQNQNVADAYYHIISCYSVELLDHGFSLKELEDIISRIEHSLSKFSARGLLNGHLEMIREAAGASIKKAA